MNFNYGVHSPSCSNTSDPVRFGDPEIQSRLRRSLNRKLRVYYALCQVLALIAFVGLLPLLAIAALAITIELLFREKKLCSPFWTELRYTQNRIFRLYKFTSTQSDGELIFTGNLLKTVYLDEIPQLIHIVRGDMMFVGPRPNPPDHYDRIRDSGYFAKVIQRAGMTGGVQTAKGSDHHGDLSLDEDYMKFCINYGVMDIISKDFQVLFNTIRLMKKAEGL